MQCVINSAWPSFRRWAQRLLTSTSESWEVNRHIVCYTYIIQYPLVNLSLVERFSIFSLLESLVNFPVMKVYLRHQFETVKQLKRALLTE